MWTEQEQQRYERHLEKHWTREGRRIPQALRPSLSLDSPQCLAALASMRDTAKEINGSPAGLLTALRERP